MPSLPQRKVGIVACSGEEMPEGTVTRLAALKVLEELRPNDTVTICLPLFLAGGEGDRAFAKFYPTIAVDGCEKRCAARATELYSNKPAASLLVDDIIAERGLPRPQGLRRLSSEASTAGGRPGRGHRRRSGPLDGRALEPVGRRCAGAGGRGQAGDQQRCLRLRLRHPGDRRAGQRSHRATHGPGCHLRHGLRPGPAGQPPNGAWPKHPSPPNCLTR